jgi:hypothetical protein
MGRNRSKMKLRMTGSATSVLISALCAADHEGSSQKCLIASTSKYLVVFPLSCITRPRSDFALSTRASILDRCLIDRRPPCAPLAASTFASLLICLGCSLHSLLRPKCSKGRGGRRLTSLTLDIFMAGSYVASAL